MHNMLMLVRHWFKILVNINLENNQNYYNMYGKITGTKSNWIQALLILLAYSNHNKLITHSVSKERKHNCASYVI